MAPIQCRMPEAPKAMALWNVETQQQRQRGHNNDAATDADQRAKQARYLRNPQPDQGKATGVIQVLCSQRRSI
jgi:hypothetical protein